MTFTFCRNQILQYVLHKKGIITERDLEEYGKDLANTLRLKNILSRTDLKQVREALRRLRVPDPRRARGGVDVAYFAAIDDAKLKVLVPTGGDRIYYRDELQDLLMTLDYAGFRNKKATKKLEAALALARRYDP